jgi:DNA polymerase-3 subunit gamma/tau
MASQSLYRKWRSQTFDELVGQEHVVQTLRNAIAEDRVAHAYLFTGPRGVGKTTMARLLAKAVNCLDPEPGRRPCGACVSCVGVAEGRAVDVIEMDAASHTSVEDAREIIERVQFRPSEGRAKVYIIDEVHQLSSAAFNALLKTLEEPPDHAIFILATTEVHKVPATILSRCQRFTFTRHTVAGTSAHLRQIGEAEGLELEEGAPEAIARAATGSMRDALGILEQLASYVVGPITVAQVHSLLGMTAAAEVLALIDALLDGDSGAALRAVNGVADQGADVRQFTRDLVERLRALLLLLASGDHVTADIGDDERHTMEAWAQRASVPHVLHWVKIFSGLDHQLRTTPYGHLPLELAVVEALVTAPPQDAGLRRQEPAPRRAEAARAAPAPPAPAARPPIQRPAPAARPPAERPAPAPSVAAPSPAPHTAAPAPAPSAAASSPAPSVAPAPAPAPSAAASSPAPHTAAPAPAPSVAAPSPAPSEAPAPAPIVAAPTPALAELAASAPAAPEPQPEPVEVAAEPIPAAPDGEGEPAGEPVAAAEAAEEPAAGAAEGGPADAEGPARSPLAAAAANADFSLLEEIEGRWEEIKRDVRPRSPAVQALLHGARPLDVEASTLVLLAASPFHKDNLEKPQNRKIVEEVVRRHVSTIVAIRCTIEAKAEGRDLRGQIREARKDELVRAAMNIFEAHIVDIEPEEPAL